MICCVLPTFAPCQQLHACCCVNLLFAEPESTRLVLCWQPLMFIHTAAAEAGPRCPCLLLTAAAWAIIMCCCCCRCFAAVNAAGADAEAAAAAGTSKAVAHHKNGSVPKLFGSVPHRPAGATTKQGAAW
jgi:hypothetical protein